MGWLSLKLSGLLFVVLGQRQQVTLVSHFSWCEQPCLGTVTPYPLGSALSLMSWA